MNFIPSRYAFCFEFFPRIIDDTRIEIIGINNFISLVLNIKKLLMIDRISVRIRIRLNR